MTERRPSRAAADGLAAHRTSPLLLAIALAAAFARPAEAERPRGDGPRVGVTHGTVKLRPDAPVPAATEVELEAARNEFEPFQIAVGGGARGLRGVAARASALRGPGGARIDGVRLYREALYQVSRRSSREGDRGEWPDALVPDVDAYAGERRNAFPFDVPPGRTRAVWAEVLVPERARPGLYQGEVTITEGDRPLATVAVRLRVRDFALPSTPSLRSAFGFSVDVACRAHLGKRFCDDDAAAAPFVERYTRAALDHRVTLMSPYYTLPTGGRWAEFDRVTGPFLDGRGRTALPGARLTTLRSGYRRDADPGWTEGRTAEARLHVQSREWPGRLFDFVFDEPRACVPEVPARASAAHAAGVRTLVTTDLERIEGCGWAGQVDIACPVVNHLHRKERGDDARSERPRYDRFLSVKGKELWWYQSCMSHGCHPERSCGPEQEDDPQSGYPSYAIDASAMQARAMEWLSFSYDVTGELYYETVAQLDTAWRPDGLCGFGGQGDGTLFYPGLPSVIGGRTAVPVESIRLKMIREGMEDHEYLKLLAALGDGARARREAREVFPTLYRVTESPPEALYRARHRLADRIEALLARRRPGRGP